jgi:hypothetical protein
VKHHYSPEVLGAYREGLTSARKSEKISVHVASCARCAGTSADLVSVSVTLASTSVSPMPERFAQRIQLAIAAESAARTAAPAVASRAPVAEPVSVPGRPDLPQRSGRRSWRLRMPELSSPVVLRTVAAAGAVVIIAGAGYFFASGGAQTGSNAASSGHTALPRPSSVTNQPAFGARTQQLSYRSHGKPASVTELTSKVDFTHKTLLDRVRKAAPVIAARLSAGPEAASPTPAGGASSTSSKAPRFFGLFKAVRLGICLTKIAAGRQLVYTEVAEYLGKPAAIIVFAPVAAQRVFDVTVVGLSCSASNSDILTVAKVPSP